MEIEIKGERGKRPTDLFSLPIRDGNLDPGPVLRQRALLFSLPIRDGNFWMRKLRWSLILLFSLPIRDGNKKSSKGRLGSWKNFSAYL